MLLSAKHSLLKACFHENNVIQSQKGGSGKTMLPTHLAVEAERGYDPAWVIDTRYRLTSHLELLARTPQVRHAAAARRPP
jgi:hypothetical protein